MHKLIFLDANSRILNNYLDASKQRTSKQFDEALVCIFNSVRKQVYQDLSQPIGVCVNLIREFAFNIKFNV